MEHNRCTICGEPGVVYCTYHMNVHRFGKVWADEVKAGKKPKHRVSLVLSNKYNNIFGETKPRYVVMLNGVEVSDCYYNMTGYVLTQGIPLPNGSFLKIPESALSTIRKEISLVNKEAK